jgi:hypothetical protein
MIRPLVAARGRPLRTQRADTQHAVAGHRVGKSRWSRRAITPRCRPTDRANGGRTPDVIPGSAARRVRRSSGCSAPPRPGRASVKRRSSAGATATTRRSISFRIRMPATVRVPSCSHRNSSSASPMLGCSAPRRSGRMHLAWTSASARWPSRSRWARPSMTSMRPRYATLRSSEVPRTRSISHGWSLPTCWMATCRSRTGMESRARSCWVMTFIVSHNGKVYEKNLGKNSAAVGAKMTTFDPGPGWKEVAR